jgi:hypothetical protein
VKHSQHLRLGRSDKTADQGDAPFLGTLVVRILVDLFNSVAEPRVKNDSTLLYMIGDVVVVVDKTRDPCCQVVERISYDLNTGFRPGK